MEDIEFILKKVEGASSIMEKLIDLAASDRVVNKDEKELLHNINNNLHEYLRTIIDRMGDQEFDKEKLRDLEKNLVTNCEKVALKDGIISADEHALLDELKTLVTELGKLM